MKFKINSFREFDLYQLQEVGVPIEARGVQNCMQAMNPDLGGTIPKSFGD